MTTMHCPICSTSNSSGAINCSACGAPIGAGAGALAPDALPAGTGLQGGNFLIEGVLGQGGFGITYRAADSTLGRRVAIKEFFPASCARQGLIVQPSSGLGIAAYRDARHKFLEEARHLARFHHSGIVAVYSVFEENNTAYMVMEYLQGRPLTQVLHERGGRMDEPEAIGIIQKVGHSLEVVHGAGLLHRDIKPDNIVACADGRVVLIDFGTAKDFAAGSTQGHTVAVTPGYAPLEQYASRAERGVYTDVYGLAATLYYLLTGEVPTAASDRAMGVLLPPVEQLNPQVGRAVARAVMQGLEIEVAKRPQSVREFLELLEGEAATSLRRGMSDEDWLDYIRAQHKELLHSTDHELQKFLRDLGLNCDPDDPLPSAWDTRKFAAHLKAREALLSVSAANAQSQPLASAPAP
ncbi:MAG TPA: serine/threonine-protein kinase [Abditibacteriaceae bacterium]|nr:serine/threonine-protein kinase [Abditibacteriaceae bacterium]